MIPIIRGRWIETIVTRNLQFDIIGHPSCSFSFEIDQNDQPIRADWQSDQEYSRMLDRFGAAKQGELDGLKLAHGVVIRHEREIRHPAVGRCDCGAEVVLSGFTNTCRNCEADYNMSGQRLAPREQWGEETGESVADILSVDNDVHEE